MRGPDDAGHHWRAAGETPFAGYDWCRRCGCLAISRTGDIDPPKLLVEYFKPGAEGWSGMRPACVPENS